MLNRAYSLLTVKAVDGDRRVLMGMATTPTTDRVGDIVEPKGVRFKNPLPLLLFHDSRMPVGTVKFSTPTDNGVEFEASIPEITEPGTLKDRVDEAWQSVKAGLIRGVSIGFRALDKGAEAMKGGGIRFTSTEVLELSLVAIPANSEATIHAIKSIDSQYRAASGEGQATEQVRTPGVTGAVVRQARKDAPTAMTNQEKIVAFKAEKDAKTARMNELMAGGDVTTLDAEQQAEFDGLETEIKGIEGHIARLDRLDQLNKAAAVPVVGGTTEQASASRGLTNVITIKQNLPEGMEFSRMVLCKAASFVECANGNFVSPEQIARKRYPDSPRIQQYLQHKTAVAGGTTTDANFAAALLETAQSLESEFLAFLRPRTILGKFGQNGVPSLRRVPFNVKIASQTSGASASWVGEGKGKPVTKFNTDSTTMLFTKIACISVITEELARFSSPGAEGVVRDELSRAVVERMDTDFIDPAKAAVSGVNPASITNGLTALTSAGTSAANVLTDLQNLINPFILANYDISDLVLIMPNSLALVLSLMENSLGQPAFAGIGINGGTLRGIPVITTQYAASGASYGNMVIAVSAGNIALADDGSVTVDASREASIEMSDAPANETATPTASAYTVSMFQTNSIALRAERTVNWKKLRSTAVKYFDDVNWGSIGSPV